MAHVFTICYVQVSILFDVPTSGVLQREHIVEALRRDENTTVLKPCGREKSTATAERTEHAARTSRAVATTTTAKQRVVIYQGDTERVNLVTYKTGVG